MAAALETNGVKKKYTSMRLQTKSDNFNTRLKILYVYSSLFYSKLIQ